MSKLWLNRAIFDDKKFINQKIFCWRFKIAIIFHIFFNYCKMLPPSALISVNRQKKLLRSKKNYGLETTASDYATGLPFSLSQCAHPHETLETQHKFCSLKKIWGWISTSRLVVAIYGAFESSFFCACSEIKNSSLVVAFFCLKQTQENACCFDSTSSGC